MSELNHIHFEGAEDRSSRQPRSRPAASYPVLKPGVNRPAGELDAFLVWLLRQAGLNALNYRSRALQRRLPACLRKLRVSSGESARVLLGKEPALHSVALDTLLIGVSSFFRDRPVFEYLEASAVPDLLRTKSGLRIYSAGVSEGQELYSMAMLLAEAGVLEQSVLLGLDCRADAIARAQAGLFDMKDLEDVPVRFRERYFCRNGSGWLLRPEIRRNVQWTVGELFDFQAGCPWDLILFRNVAIYLEPGPADVVWKRLSSLLSSGGVLVTGKAEKPPGFLPLVRVAHSVYRKIER